MICSHARESRGIGLSIQFQWARSLSSTHFLHFVALCLFLLIPGISHGQTINDNGATHSVNYTGGVQDFLIPNNPNISEITFNLRGGDGGRA